jgi:hypothetical protein
LNISNENPLVENGFLILFLDNSLCIGQIIGMYGKIGERHAYLDEEITDIDKLSYLSVCIYLRAYREIFSNQCKAGGKLFIHITSKNIIFNLGKKNFSTHLPNTITVCSRTLEYFEAFLANENLLKQIYS